MKSVYAVMNWKDVYAICETEADAQEMCVDICMEAGYDVFTTFVNYWGNSVESALEEANCEIYHWQVWEFPLF